MERHKSLYKATSSMLSPKNQRHNERTAIRAKERIDQFCARRSLMASKAEPIKAEVEDSSTFVEENKENIGTLPPPSSAPAEQKIMVHPPEIASNSSNEKLLTRQEKFLQRFINWKLNKRLKGQMEQCRKQTQKQPYVPVGNTNKAVNGMKSVQSNATSSFAPKDHKFKPPEGLKNPLPPHKLTQTTFKGRQSVYAVVPNPQKKKHEPTREAAKVYPTGQRERPGTILIGTTPATAILNGTRKAQGKDTPLPSTLKSTASKTPGQTTQNKPSTLKSTASKTPGQTTQNKPIVPVTNTRELKTTKPSVKTEPQCPVKPRPFRLPPPPATLNIKNTKLQMSGKRTVRPLQSGAANEKKPTGAVGKAKAINTNKLSTATLKPKPRLAVPMKAKSYNTSSLSSLRSTNNAQAKKLPVKIKLNTQQIKDVVAAKVVSPIAETPRDQFCSTNHFGTFVTSTQRKSNSHSPSALEFLTLDLGAVDSISPVEPVDGMGKRSTSAAKQQPDLPLAEEVASDSKKSLERSKNNKFNFVRYAESPIITDAVQADTDGKTNDVPAAEQTPLKSKIDNNKDSEECPPNYLSPYVSVSRGKVSSKKEKEKRNSIYLQTATSNEVSAEEEKQSNEVVALRRILETTRYFRKQLNDEIERLHGICDKWDAYRAQNLERLQETGGDDMINVTIGQTKLLTSKKFMQFKGLIDRCERGATSPHLMVSDGSEETKPITAVDLEGFWSMVGLQVENIDKRFANLERWRANDWLDPDHVEPQQPAVKKGAAKPKKASASNGTGRGAKPNSALQQLMRKMHADMRKKKAAQSVADGSLTDIVLTSSSKRRSQEGTATPLGNRQPTPVRRISIVVKDRKLHSAAPTILKINTPCRRRSATQAVRTNSPQLNSPKQLKHVENFKRSLTNLQQSGGDRSNLWLSAIKGAEQRRLSSTKAVPLRTPSPVTEVRSSAVSAGPCKSILKTPGTAKETRKNVVFDETLRIKKFKFTIESDESETDEVDADDEEDERAYSLRTRKVVLRPSSEFVIPK